MGKILVICGDIWHTTEVVKTGFSCLTDFFHQMTFVEDAKDMLVASDLEQYELVICCKGNHVTSGNSTPWFEEGVNELAPRDLEAYVRNGGGFLSVHAGCSFTETNASEHIDKPCREYIDFVGCRFISHPARCPVTYHVVNREHPVTAGVKDFCERDEHYQIEMTADDARILMESTSATGQKMPAAYVREMGNGRLCALIPGHILPVWQNPEFQKLLVNAMNWCMKKQEA
ncbi:MAG: ThuA domain-containing protein [Clostridiales bacterium]|nr:ThuA domain-containing protein [Clostridiales bacterium]